MLDQLSYDATAPYVLADLANEIAHAWEHCHNLGLLARWAQQGGDAINAAMAQLQARLVG